MHRSAVGQTQVPPVSDRMDALTDICGVNYEFEVFKMRRRTYNVSHRSLYIIGTFR